MKAYQKSILQLVISLEILVQPLLVVSQDISVYYSRNISQNLTFIQQPKDVIVLENSTVVLPCKINISGAEVLKGKVQWTKNKFGLGTDRQLGSWPRFTIVGNNIKADWDLEIDPVSVDDDDIYQCQVTLGYTSSLRSRKAKVEVLVPPQDPFIQEGPILNVKESRDAVLTCVAKGGKPAAKLTWYDGTNNLINSESSYHTQRMDGGKLFEASSTIVISPTRGHHNTTFRCEATNEADNLSADGDILDYNSGRVRPAAEVRLFVQYAPSVSVQQIRPGRVQEGDKATFRCEAEANPPPYPNSYKWYIDDKQIHGQRQQFYEIYNVTRSHHDKQIKCSVENELGTAMGLRSIQVKYGPTMIVYPKTTSGDKMNAVMLFCVVDSNPPPNYHWTKGSSREVISNRQNLTVPVSEDSIGTYYCHAEVPGYNTITSRPGADVLMTGPPKIRSSPTQSGVIGENIHINCAAISVPEPDDIVWMYHESSINEGNAHYRIINSPIQHGIRSTLVIRESLDTDFGPYTCSIKNSHGTSDIKIQLEQQRPFPLQITLIATFGGIIFILLVSIVCILFRKRLCCCCFDENKERENKKLTSKMMCNNKCGDTDKNNLRKVNNIVDQLANNTTHLKQELAPSVSHENDSAFWGGSDVENDGGFIRGTICRSSTVGAGSQGGTTLCGQGDLIVTSPDYQPQPDVINGGYISYGHVLDYNLPTASANSRTTAYEINGNQTVISPTSGSVLNVSDPRFSATYGNPYLKQTERLQHSTPNSSNCNMNCLPEESELVVFGDSHKCLKQNKLLPPQRTSSSEGYAALTPLRTSSSEGYGTLKRSTKKKNFNSPQRHWKNKVSVDADIFLRLPTARTASSASSAISSVSSYAVKYKNTKAPAADYVTISQAPLNVNGSSSVIGIGPGQSLQQRDTPSNNRCFGSLQRPTNMSSTINQNSQETSANTLPLNQHLNRLNNLHHPNSVSLYSHNSPPTSCTTIQQQLAANTTNSLNNSSSSQTPTPPPPGVTGQQLPPSKVTFSGMGTHV